MHTHPSAIKRKTGPSQHSAGIRKVIIKALASGEGNKGITLRLEESRLPCPYAPTWEHLLHSRNNSFVRLISRYRNQLEEPGQTRVAGQAYTTNPLEESVCKWCGETRRRVPYSVNGKNPGTVPLCDNRCCPDCGGKLELRVKPSAPKYWVHASPLQPRMCKECGKVFTPENPRKPHQEYCSEFCADKAYTRQWNERNTERRKQLYTRQWKKRKKKLELAESAEQQLADAEERVQQARKELAAAKARVAELKAQRGGKTAEDEKGAFINQHRKQGLRWKPIIKLVKAEFGTEDTADALYHLEKRYLDRLAKNPS